MLKIWGRTNSINVMKVLWCADELGLDYERFDAGMEFGVVGEPFYGELNPNRRVPTVEDDGVVLWESNVIVRYLAAKHARGSLWPEDAAERAQAEQWMDWQQTTMHPALTPVFWQLVRTPPEERDAEKIAAGAASVADLWTIVDVRLAGREYLNGAAFTMADIPLGCAVWRYYNLDIERPKLANVEAWHERLKQRPAFQSRVMLPLN